MDRELLEAIGQMMEAQAEKIRVVMNTKIQDFEHRLMDMMKSCFDPKIQALSKQVNPIPKEAIDIMDDHVDDLKKRLSFTDKSKT